jgi:hypothetical protein
MWVPHGTLGSRVPPELLEEMRLVILFGILCTCSFDGHKKLLDTRTTADQHEAGVTLVCGLPVRITSGMQVNVLLLKFKIDIAFKETERLLQEGHIRVRKPHIVAQANNAPDAANLSMEDVVSRRPAYPRHIIADCNSCICLCLGHDDVDRVKLGMGVHFAIEGNRDVAKPQAFCMANPVVQKVAVAMSDHHDEHGAVKISSAMVAVDASSSLQASSEIVAWFILPPLSQYGKKEP